ncbi:secreted RxLR effector protein 161-like [Setaria viridis]|uniref:secreted RxLR effector protein 161-like n=1 Tax=Setaria viridis TaxID=4556 RepID=UPI0014936009|nr:secreted RxLR effector protein 161-like [Setaria viridis]
MGKESRTPEVNATEYRCIIGGLRYLVHTRPDLAFAVGFLSQFMEKPHEEHLAAVKRVLRYVAGTRGYGLRYVQREDQALKLIGYSDADLAGDIDQLKSTSGIVFFLGNNPITWQSSKQKVMALSSCEEEYNPAASASCQGVSHIDTSYHFIRECIDGNRIVIGHTSTEKQLADMLTKALGRVHFQELRAEIGVDDILSDSVKA